MLMVFLIYWEYVAMAIFISCNTRIAQKCTGKNKNEKLEQQYKHAVQCIRKLIKLKMKLTLYTLVEMKNVIFPRYLTLRLDKALKIKSKIKI